jgi:hypothetical protein
MSSLHDGAPPGASLRTESVPSSYYLPVPRIIARVITGYVSHCPMGLPSHSPFLTNEALVEPRHSMDSPELFSSRPTSVIFLVYLLADVSGTLVLLLFLGIVTNSLWCKISGVKDISVHDLLEQGLSTGLMGQLSTLVLNELSSIPNLASVGSLPLK